MKKIVKYMTVFIMSFVLTIMAMGCNFGGNTGITEEIDPLRTQLYVSNFDGGIGTEWLNDFKERYEELNKNKIFEPGTDKKGVQIIIDANKIGGDSLSMQSSNNEVFFTEGVAYNDLASQGLLLDISDLVNDETDGTSIADKMSEQQKSALTALDGKYYALPHYEVYRGVSYDIDLFDKYMLYFAADKNNGNNGLLVSKTEKKAAGPDGKYNTSDDGLPATMEEFFQLCDYMVTYKGITPFVWTGMYNAYTEYIAEAIFANFSGAENLKLDYTFDSNGKTVKIVTGFSETNRTDYFGVTPIVEDVAITKSNAYLLRQELGRYYALAFLNKVMSDKRYYATLSTNQTFSHLDAQEAFIYSSLENKPIAMIIDGNYWYNEAKVSGAFERSVEDFGSRAENRNFGWMPLPGVVSGTVDESNGVTNTVKDILNAYAFINANISSNPIKVALAKDFIKFCYSDENLGKFTQITGCAKGLQYELSDENKNALSTYELSCWEMKKNADIVYPYSNDTLFINKQKELTSDIWKSVVNGQSYLTPYTAFRDSVSVQDYFKGMAISESTWKSNYGQWL